MKFHWFLNRGGTTKRVLISQSRRGVQKHTQRVKQHPGRPAADRDGCLQIHRGFSLKSFFNIGFKRAEHVSRFLSSERCLRCVLLFFPPESFFLLLFVSFFSFFFMVFLVSFFFFFSFCAARPPIAMAVCKFVEDSH